VYKAFPLPWAREGRIEEAFRGSRPCPWHATTDASFLDLPEPMLLFSL